jgi:hypothetical protein
MKITTQNIQEVLTNIEDAYFDIPFDNTKFQNEMFVVASQLTPGRAYRTIGLRLYSKIQAIQGYLISNEMSKIDIEEKEYKLTLDTIDEFEKRRIKLQIQEILKSKNYSEKLLNDALHEIETLYNIFEKLPKYTREQFELEESLHFHLKLDQSKTFNHANDGALMDMTINHDTLVELIEKPVLLENLIQKSKDILSSPKYKESMLKLDEFNKQLEG